MYLSAELFFTLHLYYTTFFKFLINLKYYKGSKFTLLNVFLKRFNIYFLKQLLYNTFMREGTLDISALNNAIDRLNEVIIRYENDVTDNIIRDSLIQRFEFTYSIALKTLSKYLIEYSYDDVKQLSFNDLIRTANQLNLLKSNLEIWSEYRKMRNLTSRTYDEEIALKVVGVIPEFYNEVLYLANKLKND